MQGLSETDCVQTASLAHIHKVAAVRQAGSESPQTLMLIGGHGGPANLLTK
jgi:hypothetical protein